MLVCGVCRGAEKKPRRQNSAEDCTKIILRLDKGICVFMAGNHCLSFSKVRPIVDANTVDGNVCQHILCLCCRSLQGVGYTATRDGDSTSDRQVLD